MGQIFVFLDTQFYKRHSASGKAPDPPPGALPPGPLASHMPRLPIVPKPELIYRITVELFNYRDPIWGLCPIHPLYRLALRARHRIQALPCLRAY